MQHLDWHPAKKPERKPIEGDSVLLEPLDVARHGEELYASTAGADSTWDYLPYGPFKSKADFMAWLAQRAPLDDPLTFTIVDREAGAARGLASLMRIVPEHGVIEIGHIWLAPSLQRTRQPTDAIDVMSRYT